MPHNIFCVNVAYDHHIHRGEGGHPQRHGGRCHMARQTGVSEGGGRLVRHRRFIMLELDHGAAYLILQVFPGFHLPLSLPRTDGTFTRFLLLHTPLVIPLYSFLLSRDCLVLASFRHFRCCTACFATCFILLPPSLCYVSVIASSKQTMYICLLIHSCLSFFVT